MEITTKRIFIVGKNWESKHPQKEIGRYNILSLQNIQTLKMTGMQIVADTKKCVYLNS